MASIAEYFTLREASATAARIPDAGRKEIAGALAVGRQRAEAAEALWSNGHAAEGLRLAADALTTTLEAVPSYARVLGPAAARAVPAPEVKGAPAAPAKDEGARVETDEDDAPAAGEPGGGEPGEAQAAKDEPSDGDADTARAEADAATEAGAEEAPAAREEAATAAAPSWREVLAARGISKERLDAIAEAADKARTAPLPRLDAEINATHTDLYQAIARARLDVDRALAYAAMSPRDLRLTQIARIATAAFLGALLIGGLYLALRTPRGVSATASATFANSPQFGAQNAVDGRPDTEWLLPDHVSGWVEATLSPPRHVSRITLLNAKNAPHFDRATREYRLELYRDGEQVRGFDGSWDEYSRDPRPVSHDVDLDGIDRVRFVSRSSHNLGGGLAEMTIEE